MAGKTSLASRVAKKLGYEHLDFSAFVCGNDKFQAGYDEALDSTLVDEDAALDAVEAKMQAGGVVVDYHSAELFPERWFSAVCCLTCSTEVLYDRLKARGYKAPKISENIECEVMQVLQEETREAYPLLDVIILPSETKEHQRENKKKLVEVMQRIAKKGVVICPPPTSKQRKTSKKSKKESEEE